MTDFLGNRYSRGMAIAMGMLGAIFLWLGAIPLLAGSVDWSLFACLFIMFFSLTVLFFVVAWRLWTQPDPWSARTALACLSLAGCGSATAELTFGSEDFISWAGVAATLGAIALYYALATWIMPRAFPLPAPEQFRRALPAPRFLIIIAAWLFWMAAMRSIQTQAFSPWSRSPEWQAFASFGSLLLAIALYKLGARLLSSNPKRELGGSQQS